MPATSSFQLTLFDATYFIHTRADSSRLEVAQDSETLGIYDSRWLGLPSQGGYWVHFKDQISTALLLNMEAIARLIDQHRDQVLDTELHAIQLEGRLRSIRH